MIRNNKIILLSLISIVVIVLNNVFFYNIILNTLQKNHEREISSIAANIQTSIEQSRLGLQQYEDMIGEKLRSDAIATKFAISSPKLDNVKPEELMNLKNKLNLYGLSLLKKTSDDIVIEKSTNPDEINLSTNKWGLWYNAFSELFNKKDVSIDWGQKLPNYWSGPYEVAAADTKTISKWGYYYDGTTDYIIDPYVADKEYKQYQRTTGTEAIIQNTIESHPFLLEITGINPGTFGKDIKFNTPKGELVPLVHRPYFFGSYEFDNMSDETKYVNQAVETKKTVTYEATIKGKLVEKTFIPIQTTFLKDALGHEPGDGENIDLNTYVLCIVADHDMILAGFQDQFRTLITIIFVVSILCIALLLFAIRMIGKSRDKAVQQTSQTYTEEVNQMFLNIRGQRHDFLNHVSVIHSFLEMGKHEELKQYTNTLIGEIGEVNDVIKIGQPEIAAIVQAKMVMAINKKIQFNHKFENMDNIMTGTKSVDVVRIIGNLMDNAFDEIENMPQEDRWVKCIGWLEGKYFNFQIANPLTRDISEDEKKNLLKEGYSTKEHHTGLGLAITRDLITKYRGQLRIDSAIDQISFHISIPIH